MQFEVKIGERKVLASGNLVLAPGDREVTFTLEGMNYIMAFTPTAEPGPFRVRFDRRDQTHLHVDTRGQFPVGTIAWTYAGILQFTDADIDLDLMIYSESGEADCSRRIGFTFSARPRTEERIDPTRSGPASLTPRSEPPALRLPPG